MDEKKLLQAFLIIILFFLVWHWIMPKKPAQQPEPQQVSKEQLGPTQEIELEEGAVEEPVFMPEEAVELPQAEIGDFTVTYSPRGGYIKKVVFNPYQDELLFQNIGYIPQDKDKEYSAQIQNGKIVFTAAEGEKKEFIFGENTLVIKLSSPTSSIVLFSNQLPSHWLDKRYQFFYYKKPGAELIENPFNNIKEASYSNVEFAGARNRYYCVSLLKGSYNIAWAAKGEKNDRKVYLSLSSPPQEIPLYIGPQERKLLEPFELQEVVRYGRINAIARLVIGLLNFFYSFTKNWGLSIILFSIMAYAIQFPLTYKSTQGMKQVKEFQKLHKSEIEKIKEKYKDNPHKMHQEMGEMYKKHGFNPLAKGCASGCLPSLIQIPLIWALWSAMPRMWEFKGISFLWIKDLAFPDRTIHLPFNLPLLGGDWINILPVLNAIVMFLQMKFANPHTDPEQEQQQKMMAMIFPLLIGYTFYHFPSALLLYWLTTSVLTFVTQWKLMRAKSNQIIPQQ